MLNHSSDERARAALSTLDQYVRSHFARFRAAIERYYPHLTHLFPPLTSRDPAAALQAMRTLLNWLNEAESAEQKQIVQVLTERGLDLYQRQRLTELAELASSITETAAPCNSQDINARDQALLSLHRWYSDWTTTARALIKRKDHRNSLGIGERQPRRAVDV